MFFENSFIYFPTREFLFSPAEFGLVFDDVFFKADDGTKLHGWYIPRDGARTLLLFFHGNAGNLSDRTDNIIHLHQQVGVDVFIMDYRGYGKSEGRPDEKGLCMDGRAALAKARELADGAGKKIAIFGRSLGGAVAADVAADNDCDGLILESTFKSIPDIANALFPILPAGRVLKTKFKSIDKIGRIDAPKLIIHGERDSLIPFSHGRALYDAAPPPKEFYPIAGADHNDTYITGGQAYFRKIAGFIRALEPAAG